MQTQLALPYLEDTLVVHCQFTISQTSKHIGRTLSSSPTDQQTNKTRQKNRQTMTTQRVPMVSLDMVEAQHAVRKFLEDVSAMVVGIINEDESTVGPEEDL